MVIDAALHQLFSGWRSGVMAISDYKAGASMSAGRCGSGLVFFGVRRVLAQPLRHHAGVLVLHKKAPTREESQFTCR